MSTSADKIQNSGNMNNIDNSKPIKKAQVQQDSAVSELKNQGSDNFVPADKLKINTIGKHKDESLHELINEKSESITHENVEKLEKFLNSLPPDSKNNLIKLLDNHSQAKDIPDFIASQIDELSEKLEIIGDDMDEIMEGLKEVLKEIPKDKKTEKKAKTFSDMDTSELIEMIKNTSPDKILKFKPDDLQIVMKKLPAKYVYQLDPEQLAAIIKRLSPEQIGKLDSETTYNIIQKLPEDKIADIPPEKTSPMMINLKSPNILNISPKKIACVMEKMLAAQMLKLSPDKIANIIQILDPIKIEIIKPMLINMEPARLMSVIQNIPPNHLYKINSVLAKLDKAKIAFLNKNLPQNKKF